jgi:orotidine-5'-phosphate decarboxylase
MNTQERPKSAEERIILALDVADGQAASKVLDAVEGHVRWIKIGLQLFTAEGPTIVKETRQRGFDVFLDLKFHDIPNTVAHAVRSAVGLGVSMTTIHAGGGPEMIRAASKAAEGSGLLLLGVTVLTSMDSEQLMAVGLPGNAESHVLRLARLAHEYGIGGLVASPHEIEALKKSPAHSLPLVIPGIRPAGSDTGDQKRTMDAGTAVRMGADWLVVGRPILSAPDPIAAFKKLAQEIRSATH